MRACYARVAVGMVMAVVFVLPLPAMESNQGKAQVPSCLEEQPAEWRHTQIVEEIEIQEERVCWPDNPYEVAAFVKGTNNLTMPTLLKTQLAADAVIKKNDHDGDGDPDEITLKLEIAELNGSLPEPEVRSKAEFSLAPGIQPRLWVLSPKLRFLAQGSSSVRFPSPVIRVEAGDKLQIILENTHDFTQALVFFGVDRPLLDAEQIPPGQSKVYEFHPRQPGTMFYQASDPAAVALGLIGMFVVEENRPNNWVQTLNLGAGKVRHPATGIREKFDQEYDLQYQAIASNLQSIVQAASQGVRSLPPLLGQWQEAYPLLNGHLYPYVLQDSPIVVKPDQFVKLRLFNAQSEPIMLAFQGHRAIITHYDGIEHSPLAQVMRDMLDLAPGQRLDLNLVTSNDGLHSFGPGVWPILIRKLMGAPVLKPLGAIVYESVLGAGDTPFQVGGFEVLAETRQAPEKMLTSPSPAKWGKRLYDFAVGLFLGLLAYVLFANRKYAQERVRSWIKG